MRHFLKSSFLILSAIGCVLGSQAGFAQSPAGTNAGGEATPGARQVLRFLTEGDFPPFNFFDEDGVLTGFNIDLARAICIETNRVCDIRVKPWEGLIVALNANQGDAIIAAQAVTPTALEQVDFTTRYFHTPGRFIVRRRGRKVQISREGLFDQRIGVAAGSTHEAYLNAFFGDARIIAFRTQEKARQALMGGKLDALFGDAISLSFWLNGTLSKQCCEFRGGAYLEPKYFGDGLGIAVRKSDSQLKSLINIGLARVKASGRYQELVARYFPFRLY